MSLSESTALMDSLEFAGSMLERHDLADCSSPGLLEVTGIKQSGMATASGLNDYDYQNLSSLSLGLKNLNQLNTVNRIPIPPEIMEHFKHIKCHCMMGLFPEIGRAWLTIDSDIYIWTYEQSRDVAYFDGLSHLIVSVGLVVPKPGVFIADVKYLLVLTTPIEIVILGVTFGDSNGSPNRSISTSTEEMQLLNKPIFVLNTDNIAITCIEGTDDGRIFLGGRDGCLYEISYQAESNWFGKRCKKVNHSQGLMSHLVPGIFKVFSENDSISKLTIDNSRKLLYALTEKGAIEAWDIGGDSNSVKRIARVTQNEIASSAGNVLRTIEPSVFKPVAALCPLSLEDSPQFHLIAITQSGVRFYFSTVPVLFGIQQQQLQQQQSQQQAGFPHYEQRPQGLYLLHVRLPPGYTPNTNVGKPKQIHSAYYSHGSLLMVSTPQPDQDLLWSLSSEPFPSRQNLVESSTVMTMDGQVWAIAEVKPKDKITVDTPLRAAQVPKKVALLTNQGVHIVSLMKSVDILQQLLLACHGPHNEAVKAYFQVQSEPQACATSLLIACIETLKGTELGEWAAQAFILYGGEPYFEIAPYMGGHSAAARPLSFNSPVPSGYGESQASGPRMFMSTPFSASRPASSVQQSLMQQTQFGNSPVPNVLNHSYNNNLPQTMSSDSSNFHYSAKHAGLYLHMSRLLRSVWRKRCIDEKLHTTISQHDCAQILEDLYAIKRFLESITLNNLVGLVGKNMSNATTLGTSSGGYLQQQHQQQQQQQQMYQGLSGMGSFGGPQHQPYGGSTTFGAGLPVNQQKNTMEDALTEEKKSLDALIRLIKHSCEVLALWKILCEHQCHLLVAKLTKEQQAILHSCTFRDLILSRSDICGLLIVTLINSYLNDNASVGSISSKLREVCPNLYRHEDAVSHKASEILLLSKSCNDQDEKDERLRTALQLCKSAAPNLPLTSICQQFTSAGFYSGVIELCSICAAKSDPSEAALHYYRNNEPVEDQEGYMAFQSRMSCFKEIKLMLEYVYTNVCGSKGGSIYPSLESVDRDKLANNQLISIIGLALQCQDQLLHIAVYEWLLSHNLLGELLEISEPSLGAFLGRAVNRTPENLILADLLWKYHERNGQHAAASKILDKLANIHSEAMSLQQRIEYLARAVMCMRSDTVGYSAHNGVLLKDLEDKLEVAQIQKQVLDAMSILPENSMSMATAIKQLNSTLYNLTQLYSDFAERFELWECKLTILNCSHHNDPLLIESVWTHILDRELERPDSNTERCRRLLTKVKSLALEYESSGHCFPLPFIVRELELRCFRLKMFDSPVPEALIEMNLDVDSLLNIYSRLVSMNERVWVTEEDELYLVRSTAQLLSIVASQPNLVQLKDRRKVIAKSQDLISACLSILYTKPDGQSHVDNLRETQSKLNRIHC
ncbi:nuclear pore complex protein Nup154 [Uranotaenia lowii]|uniref:nuclear pore complex protein Nup154 n=1 Tax=Uranotaenia lowii TaxID=190385 RepID=UPI00247848FE|nr:nuclear pore complex protein Nup154 [Uranotaenia lowii]XP_055597783.1 nuclear pore complex protein Nup154 [Uranotaenia lowii]